MQVQNRALSHCVLATVDVNPVSGSISFHEDVPTDGAVPGIHSPAQCPWELRFLLASQELPGSVGRCAESCHPQPQLILMVELRKGGGSLEPGDFSCWNLGDGGRGEESPRVVSQLRSS